MVTKSIDVNATNLNLQELLSEVEEGTEIIFINGDKPVARLTPVVEKKPRKAGLFPNSVWMSDDFDDPLPDEFWLGEE